MQVQVIPSVRSKRKSRVAAYIRVSSLGRDQDESFENQAAYFEKKIKGKAGWEFAGIYGERASGTHTENRDEFKRMIEDALDMKINLILCKSVSRWARNTIEGLENIKLLVGNGVDIIFEQEGIDTRNPGVMLQLNLAASIAQNESESISENMKWSYRNRAAQGKFKAAKGKYFGFNTDDGCFHHDDNSPIVREMFERYAAGESLEEIAEKVNEKGALTTRGNPWKRTSVKCILQNEVYVGDVRFQKRPSRNVITKEIDPIQARRYIKNHHEGIVSRALWDRVQRRLERKSALEGSR